MRRLFELKIYIFTLRMQRSSLFFTLLLANCIVFCQVKLLAQHEASSSLSETGLWNGVYLKARLTDKIGYYGEHHYRLRNSEDNLTSFVGRNRQFYNRAGIVFFVNNYFELVVGPTLVLNFSPDKNNPNLERFVYEPRIWHQWLFMMPSMGRLKLYHQFRFEHRWKRSNVINSDFQYTNRYRYKFFAYFPLNHSSIREKTFYFSPSFEIFLHSGKSVIMNPFEDFRTYNGFGYVYNKNITFFAGHMWTIGQNPTGFEYRKTHILRLNMFIGLDGRKIDDKLPKMNIGY